MIRKSAKSSLYFVTFYFCQVYNGTSFVINDVTYKSATIMIE